MVSAAQARPGRRRLALLAVATTLGLAGLLSGPAANADAPRLVERSASETAAPLSDAQPLKDLAACLADRKQGDLVLLIDTSSSLGGDNGTDPTAVRVAAAQAVLGRLATSFGQIGAQVDVSIAGFDDDVSQVVDFTPLTGDALAGLSDQLTGFAERDHGAETDYWSALTWLNRSLKAKAQTRGSDLNTSCQAALWFTDGEFTISARDGNGLEGLDPLVNPTKDIPGFEGTPLDNDDVANAAKDAAEGELCRVGGPADQMRAAGVTLIGFGLQRTGTDGAQFDFMRRYVTNDAGDCGAQPGRGVFVPAASVGDLFITLTEAFDPAAIHIDPRKLCQVSACPEGAYPLALDNTLSTIHLAAVVDDGSGALIRSGIRVEIAPPGGAPPVLINGDGPDTGTASTTTANADYRWYAGGPLTIDLNRVGPDWAGTWNITFVDTTGTHPDAVSNINLSLTSDFAVQPVIVPGTPWRAGQTSGGIALQAQTASGAALDVTALPPTFTVTSTVTLPGKSDAVVLDASLGGEATIELPADTTPGQATVTVDLNGEIAGQPLGTVTRQVTVQVLPPYGAPTVAPNQVVDFGSFEGMPARPGTLTVVGPEVGDGCVTISTGSSISTPPGVSTVDITGPGGCFPVPSGQTVQVPLTLQTGQQGNGQLEGEISVGLAPATDPSKVSQAPIRYRAEMQKLPNPPVKWAILIGAMLLGLLIPLALMWLARRLSARFPSGDAVTLQSLAFDVKIGSGGLTLPDGAPIGLPRMPWSSVPAPTGGRSSLLVSGVPLVARAGWRVTEPGYAQVDDGARTVGASGTAPHSDGAGRPRLPLSVQGTWAVLVPESLATSPLADVGGRLLLVVDTAADDGVRQHLIGTAEREAPALFDDARNKARAANPGAPDLVPAGPPAGPQYPGFAEPAADEWGSAQPVPGWGDGGSTPTGDWGNTSAGTPASGSPDGWGDSAGSGDWGSPPPHGPAGGQPPRGPSGGNDGW
jgi:hypothetical protein